MDCIIPAVTILMKNVPFQFEHRLFPIISEDILDSDEVPAFDLSISDSAPFSPTVTSNWFHAPLHGPAYYPKNYISISSNHFPGQVLHFQGPDGKTLAFLCTATPPIICSHLDMNISGAFEDCNPLTFMDTKALGIHHTFQSFHFSVYNRHSTQPGDSPPPPKPKSKVKPKPKSKAQQPQASAPPPPSQCRKFTPLLKATTPSLASGPSSRAATPASVGFSAFSQDDGCLLAELLKKQQAADVSNEADIQKRAAELLDEENDEEEEPVRKKARGTPIVELDDEEAELAKSLQMPMAPSSGVLSIDGGASQDGDLTDSHSDYSSHISVQEEDEAFMSVDEDAPQAKNTIDFEDEFESDSQVGSKRRAPTKVEPEEKKKLTKRNF
ncbi:hypothetical protein JAAARDRAFT_187397 [Jaapia argillacea MUCL 33604]|uniref:Uncharacterized protein n=1 Tax=Jaapia argillacea MUCL 33604 TaxID=933084 RepID=A0A067QAP3_9AGAM|nr:hypothetical protein JAAARDRAFT_187397 [Jaapia argillacea MUCL 33604]